jgi:hypothetical protein
MKDDVEKEDIWKKPKSAQLYGTQRQKTLVIAKKKTINGLKLVPKIKRGKLKAGSEGTINHFLD